MQDDLERIQRNLNEIMEDLQRSAGRLFNELITGAMDPAEMFQFMRQMGLNTAGFPEMRSRQPSYDPYKVLGLERSASDEEVKKRYRELMHVLHPDKSGTPGTCLFFQMVQAAYQSIERERGW